MLAPYHPLQLVLGFNIWAIWFVLMYAVLSVSCLVDPPSTARGAYTWINGGLLLLTIVTTALLLHWAKQAWHAQRTKADTHHTATHQTDSHQTTMPQATQRFITWLAIALHLFAAVVTLTIGLTVIFLPPCL